MKLFNILLALFLFSSVVAKADAHDELVHFSAHAGMGYIATTASYGLLNKGLGLDKTTSKILSFGVGLAANLVYKKLEGATGDSTQSYISTGVGSLGAVGTITLFNW